ncbi:hypothetical protein PDE_03982 [Penicillium oxalicum 114-2]|uniref:Uncharacterized protein n=1 Tax=Penicillium oxalicum (strain 114-2 / CGMCC 5302) TaxID=933388 RepID=S7ZK24_PENO1|nr:hypothetical protein PDE_03982 [Penicillium oxalicum 114-2]
MPSTYIFTASPYTKDEVPLGSIVPDILYPNEDAIKPLLTDNDFFSSARDSDLSAHVYEDSFKYLQGTLLAVWKTLCSIFWRVESARNFEVTAEKGYTYSLKEPKRFFAVLVQKEQGVREFLEECYKERLRPVLIVGYRTLLNAKLVHADNGSLTVSASGQVTAGGGSDVSNDSTGAHIEVGHGQKAGEGVTLRLDGERIFAIKFRAINIRIVQGDMVTSLERSNPNSWRIFPQTRGKTEKAEVIEALLEESDFAGEGEVVLNGDEETFVKQVQEDALLKDTAESQDFSTSVFFGSQNSGMQIGVSNNNYLHPKLSFMQPEEWQREIVKRRDRSEDQMVQASERNRQTTFEELMRYCHNFLSRPLKVETDLRATIGTIPVPTGKCCPTQLRPWADFPARQQEIYQSIYRYLQPAEEDAPRLFVPLTRVEYFGQQLGDRPINSEQLLENYERIAVETHVQDIIAELCKFPGARDQFGLGDGVRFDNDANSLKESEFAKTVTKHSSNVHFQPNKFYVHQVDGSSSTLLMKAGYRSPNKLSVESLRVGLRDMALWEELVNSNNIPLDKEGKLKYNAERLVCSAIAQEYHVMIQQGLAYSYVTNGLARVLLHVPYDDPGTLYYYLCEPNREVNGEDERNFQYPKTSIARVLCLCLMSFSSSPRDQEWRSSALSQLHTWITSFDQTYSQIHEQELEQTCDGSENAEVTEEMVNEAARSEDRGAALMVALLENRGDEIKITEEVVIAAARNESIGPEVIALLLEKRGDEFKITQEVVKAAARNESSGPEVIALLLEKRGDEFKITEEVVKAAAENKACGARFMTSLFKNRGTSKGVRISDDQNLENVSPTEGLAIDDTEDPVETIEELCGLAGISPKTRSKTDWPGSAEFSEENQTVAISYTLLTDEGQTAHSEIFLSRISHVLEGFCSAAGLTQARGLCCDSFTVLKLSAQGQETQSTFCGELVPVKFQLAADLAKAVKLAQAPVPEKPAFEMLLAKSKTILEHVLPDLTQIQGFNGIQWCFQLCALAVQFLCLGFVSKQRSFRLPMDRTISN